MYQRPEDAMGLSDAARKARDAADASGDPGDTALAAALESAEAVLARDQLRELEPEYETTRLPTPKEAGFPDALHIEKPDPPEPSGR
jgi:hypothetical protein